MTFSTSRPGSTRRRRARADRGIQGALPGIGPPHARQARYVGLQRHLQPPGPARCARLDDRDRASIRRSRRPPHRPQEQGKRAEARNSGRLHPEPHAAHRRHEPKCHQRPLPNEYLPELIEANGEATVRATLESHFISPAAFDILLRKPFGAGDFEAFLIERQRTIQEAIEDCWSKSASIYRRSCVTSIRRSRRSN